MNWFLQLISNRILIIAIIAWFVAQVLKTIINFIVNKEWKLERLVGSGGMPSSHSATVCSLATATAFAYGLGSFEFAIAAILAIIVMYDARGVRRETGKQAVVIKQITEYLEAIQQGTLTPEFEEEKLKELVGHTPLQVGMGAILGTLIGILGGIFWM
ncbi:MAG: divergent PAP2 family protein [Lachnospiraceae bacterium]|nr:divergent PAP2 family protein [Lachnospiraceae bacterium]